MTRFHPSLRLLLILPLLLSLSCARTKTESPENAPKVADVQLPEPVLVQPPVEPAPGREEKDAVHQASTAQQPVEGGVVGGVIGGYVGGTPASASASRHKMFMPGAPPPSTASELGLYQYEDSNTEEYGLVTENRFLDVRTSPLSTFGIDVDRASYSNVRRYLAQGVLPPRDAVRIEELVNYFTYDYPDPSGDAPFSITTEVAACPWNEQNSLVRIGLQGRRMKTDDLPPSNLVFLLDVSGSMHSPDKLPLLKSAMSLVIEQLRPQDKVTIVVYAGSAGLVLPPTSGAQKGAIWSAVERLEAGGSTAGGQGILLAYEKAKESFVRGGNNRVILATDGDFNVGVNSLGDLERLIEEKRKDGIFLTVLGFGTGNIKDSKMELLADKGNGNYAYIDGMQEARKVLIQEMGGTLFTIAKDVKLQIEFNPALVGAYRLIGYENRVLRNEDFNDDRKDSGDLGAGHSVTALYEIVPPGAESGLADVDPLKYQRTAPPAGASAEMMTVKLRYKEPDGDESRLLTRTVLANSKKFELASDDLQFAAAVAELGLLLRDSSYKGSGSFDHVIATATRSQGRDEEGYRRDFVQLAQQAASLSGEQVAYRKR